MRGASWRSSPGGREGQGRRARDGGSTIPCPQRIGAVARVVALDEQILLGVSHTLGPARADAGNRPACSIPQPATSVQRAPRQTRTGCPDIGEDRLHDRQTARRAIARKDPDADPVDALPAVGERVDDGVRQRGDRTGARGDADPRRFCRRVVRADRRDEGAPVGEVDRDRTRAAIAASITVGADAWKAPAASTTTSNPARSAAVSAARSSIRTGKPSQPRRERIELCPAPRREGEREPRLARREFGEPAAENSSSRR